MEQVERPEVVTEKHLNYLDDLRKSGATNMHGAGEYLERSFSVDRKDANIILTYWMKTFSDRQSQIKVLKGE